MSTFNQTSSRTSLLLGLFLFAVVVSSQQDSTGLPKAGQRQQIFHQKSPSQQLASSNIIELGKLANQLLGDTLNFSS
jgi:hypothetical protein